MLASVGKTNEITFQHGAVKGYDRDTILPDNVATRSRVTLDRLGNATTLYTAKGLKGSRNANFYEFLTMGNVAYLAGSATLIALFNAVNKFFPHADAQKAGIRGGKMALGVVLYGVMKMISKNFISKPVQALTGINTDMPYAKINYELPDNIYDTDITSIEHHKVFESVEFPRFDLLSKDYYAKIAKKNGHGENLNDPAHSVKPAIREVISRSGTAKNISQYLWAAVGVGVAMQKPWDTFFMDATFKFWKGKNFINTIKAFPKTLAQSSAEFFKGAKTGNVMQRHAGKMLLGVAALSSVLGIINSVVGARTKKCHSHIIKQDERCVVS